MEIESKILLTVGCGFIDRSHGGLLRSLSAGNIRIVYPAAPQRMDLLAPVPVTRDFASYGKDPVSKPDEVLICALAVCMGKLLAATVADLVMLIDMIAPAITLPVKPVEEDQKEAWIFSN